MGCCNCCCGAVNGECCGPPGEKVCCKEPRVCCGQGVNKTCCQEGEYCCKELLCCAQDEECCGTPEEPECCPANKDCCFSLICCSPGKCCGTEEDPFCCGVGECCVDGECVTCDCESDEDCTEGECCVYGGCVPCDECETDGDCGCYCRAAFDWNPDETKCPVPEGWSVVTGVGTQLVKIVEVSCFEFSPCDALSAEAAELANSLNNNPALDPGELCMATGSTVRFSRYCCDGNCSDDPCDDPP